MELYMDEKWKLSKKGSSSSSSRRSSDGDNYLKRSTRAKMRSQRSFTSRCATLVKEQRGRFYIMRRCVTMLICWRDYPWFDLSLSEMETQKLSPVYIVFCLVFENEEACWMKEPENLRLMFSEIVTRELRKIFLYSISKFRIWMALIRAFPRTANWEAWLICAINKWSPFSCINLDGGSFVWLNRTKIDVHFNGANCRSK